MKVSHQVLAGLAGAALLASFAGTARAEEPRSRAEVEARAAAAADARALAECRGQGFASSRRSFLGVEATPITPELRRHFGSPEGTGVLVSRVIEGGPAARAGIAVGDVLTRCAGSAVAEPRDLRGAVRDRKGGDVVEVEIFREGKARQVGVKLEDRDSCAFDVGQVFAPGDLEELSRLGALADTDALRQLGELNIDLSGLDLDGLVSNAVKLAVAGMEQALASGELQRELETLKDGRVEEIEQRMQEVARQLEKLEQKLEAEGGARGDQARAEVDRARQEVRRELERRKVEVQREVEEARREARQETAEAQREIERAKREAAKAAGSGGSGGGGEIL